MAGSSFDIEAFKAQMKEELLAANSLMMKEAMEEMAKIMKGKQPEQPTAPIDLDDEIPIRERVEEEIAIVADSGKKKDVVQAESVEESEWAKNLNKNMARMQMMMKEKGIDTAMDYADLDEGDDPLPPKFKFPNMKKFTGTDDPHLHLKQFATYMKATGLTRAQIVKQFPMSLEGAPVRWYYAVELYVQSDWKELCTAFVKQYNLNIQLAVSLREL